MDTNAHGRLRRPDAFHKIAGPTEPGNLGPAPPSRARYLFRPRRGRVPARGARRQRRENGVRVHPRPGPAPANACARMSHAQPAGPCPARLRVPAPQASGCRVARRARGCGRHSNAGRQLAARSPFAGAGPGRDSGGRRSRLDGHESSYLQPGDAGARTTAPRAEPGRGARCRRPCGCRRRREHLSRGG